MYLETILLKSQKLAIMIRNGMPQHLKPTVVQ